MHKPIRFIMTQKFVEEINRRISMFNEIFTPDFEDFVQDDEDKEAFGEFVQIFLKVFDDVDFFDKKWKIMQRDIEDLNRQYDEVKKLMDEE